MFSLISPTWTRFSIPSAPVLITPDAEYIEMNIKVVPDWNVSLYVSWTPPDNPDGVVGDPLYQLYYSESEQGPFLQLSAEPTSDLHFFTTWQNQDSKIFEQYITIECIYEDGSIFRSYPVYPSRQLPKWHILRYKDIIRRESILLRKFVGTETIIWNPKYTGKRCTECWDPVTLKVVKDHCKTCYGTSFEGGYDVGMKTLMQYSSIDPQSSISYQGRVEPVTIQAWTIPTPLIQPDSIVLRTNDRKLFKVEGHSGSTEMLTNIQRQTVMLRELGRDSIEALLFNNNNYIDVMPVRPHVHI